MDLAAILISQYQASLEMLKQTIMKCPVSIWNADSDKNKFWQVAYHAIYFVHEYLADSEKTFTPWVKHREVYDFDETRTFEPYDKETILEYLAFCQQHVAERVPQLKLDEPEGHGRSMHAGAADLLDPPPDAAYWRAYGADRHSNRHADRLGRGRSMAEVKESAHVRYTPYD
jgi:hypothetical protein